MSRVFVVSLGFGNRLIICRIKNCGHPLARVLLRLFGGNILPQDAPIRTLDSQTETLIFYAIGREQLGPALLATLPGGRIEQFLPSRRLSVDEWVNSCEVNLRIARTVARFHLLTLPIAKVPWNLTARVNKCLEQFKKRRSDLQEKGYLMEELSGLINFPFQEEVHFLERLLKKLSSRVVFASNDLNRSNFLVLQDDSGRDLHPLQVMAIDYEFCSYNYRACDLGNLFAMKVFDFGSETVLTGHSYPSIEYRRQFLQAYLDEVALSGNCPHDWDARGTDSLEHLLLECLIGAMATRLVDIAWTLRDLNVWVDMQRCKGYLTSQLDFSVFYYERKRELLTEYPHLVAQEELQ